MSPGRTPASAAGPSDVLDHQRAFGLRPARARRAAAAARCRPSAAARVALAALPVVDATCVRFFLEFRDLAGDACDAAVAPHFQLHVGAGLDAGDDARQLARRVPRTWPLTLRMMSPDLMPALSAGPPGVTEPISAPRGRSRPKDSASAAVTGWMPTPMRPRCTLPVDTSCWRTFVGHVDRDGERQAHVAAALAVDLRVDAHHLAIEVEQRAAGVARDSPPRRSG